MATNPRWTPKNYRGSTFLVEHHEDEGFVIFHDPARSLAAVCRVEISEKERTNPVRMDALLNKVATAIAADYRRQYQYQQYRMELLAASKLSVEEMSVGVGLTPIWKEKLLPKKKRAKTQPQNGKARRSIDM